MALPFSSAAPLPRVCIVLPITSVANRDVANHFECYMYIINMNYMEEHGDSDKKSLKILITGDFFRDAALCVVGWTLYVFEGYSNYHRVPQSRNIYKYRLSPRADDSLDSTKLELCGFMNAPKLYPGTLVTPDENNVVVFSNSVHSSPSHRCDFELFNLITKTCTKLPQLRLSNNPNLDVGCLIEYFSFINNSVFFVQTTRGMFVIDIKKYLLNDPNSDDPTWTPHGFQATGSEKMTTSFQLIGEGDICLTPFHALDFGIGNSTGKWCYKYPYSTLSTDGGIYHIMPLDITHPNISIFCTYSLKMVEVVRGERWAPFVALDVYSCNALECKMELIHLRQIEDNLDIPLPGTVHIKSLSIRLDEQPSRYMNVLHSSMIPTSQMYGDFPGGLGWRGWH